MERSPPYPFHTQACPIYRPPPPHPTHPPTHLDPLVLLIPKVFAPVHPGWRYALHVRQVHGAMEEGEERQQQAVAHHGLHLGLKQGPGQQAAEAQALGLLSKGLGDLKGKAGGGGGHRCRCVCACVCACVFYVCDCVCACVCMRVRVCVVCVIITCAVACVLGGGGGAVQ